MTTSKNDARIKEYLEKIEEKTKALGKAPKPHYMSDGILPSGTNINIINTTNKLVDETALVLRALRDHEAAAEFLGLSEVPHGFEEYLDDLKLRAKIIQYNAEKRKLDALKKELADLRSAEAKTSDAIDKLAGDL